jgi:predicted phage-related endonuclease
VCHLDYRVWGDAKTLVECKTRAYTKGWGPDGSTDIPPDVWAQVQHEMLVTGATRCHVAVLFGHHTFRVYDIPRNLVFHTALVEKLQTFWFDNVVAQIPPEPTGHDLDTSYLSSNHHDDGTVISATPEQAALVRLLAERIGYLNDAQEAVEETKNRIKALLGDAVGLQSPYGVITWKTTAEREYVEWKKVAEDLAEALDSEYKDNILSETAYDHTIRQPGVPRFLFEGLAADMEV